MKIIAQAYPNNELRVVICRDSQMRALPCMDDGGASDRMSSPGSPLDITPELKTARGENPPQASIQGVPRPGYGGHPRPTRFGVGGRRGLLRAGGALERLTASPAETCFLTGTLPGSTSDAMRAMQDYSSYVVNLLKAKLAKLGTVDTYSLYVWELQKRGALHLHYALVVTDSAVRKSVVNEFPRIWRQIIDAVGRLSGVDMWARGRGGSWSGQKEVLQADAQECSASPGRYLAKYCSKEAAWGGSGKDHGGGYKGPVRWWGVSRPLLREVKRLTQEVISIGVPWRNVAQIKESILSILDGMNAKIQRYTDKAKSAEVFVSYDKENYMEVFREIAGLLRVAPRNGKGDLCDASLGNGRGCNYIATDQAAMESPVMADSNETQRQHQEVSAGNDGVCGSNPGERRVSLCEMDIWR